MVVYLVPNTRMSRDLLNQPLPELEHFVHLNVSGKHGPLIKASDNKGNVRILELFDHAFKVQHPGLLRCFGLVPKGNSGEMLYAIETMFGITLDKALIHLAETKQQMPLIIVAWMGARLAESLHHLHTLHDDNGSPLPRFFGTIDPEEISMGGGGELKLLRFGHAHGSPDNDIKQLGQLLFQLSDGAQSFATQTRTYESAFDFAQSLMRLVHEIDPAMDKARFAGWVSVAFADTLTLEHQRRLQFEATPIPNATHPSNRLARSTAIDMNALLASVPPQPSLIPSTPPQTVKEETTSRTPTAARPDVAHTSATPLPSTPLHYFLYPLVFSLGITLGFLLARSFL